MVKSAHPTHISIPSALSPSQAPDDDVDMAYDGPLDSPPSGQGNHLDRGEGDAEEGYGAREVPDAVRKAELLKPRGILKNAPGRVDAAGREIPAGDHLTWDEGNLALTEIQKDSLMKIDEPKTPFVTSEQLGELPPDIPDFDLSGAQVSPGSRGRGDESFHLGDRSRSQSTDAAAIIAANTRYNAQLGQLPSPPKLTESPTFSSPFLTSDEALPAEGISRGDSARERTPSITSRQASRSASFSLPDVKSGKMVRRPSTSAGSVHGEEMVEEEEEDDEEANMDPETLKKHREFKARRKGHYSNEAEAMRLAQALIAQEDDQDEE